MDTINTTPLFLNLAVGSGSDGGTSNSDIIDLRTVNRQNAFSIAYKVGASGEAATAATTNFKYLIASGRDGTYVPPTNGDKGTIGTAGSGAGSCGFLSFTPVLAPFMKVQVVVGTSGTAKVTAELNAQ